MTDPDAPFGRTFGVPTHELPYDEAPSPLVPGGSDRDAVVAWFSGCMDGSSASSRATAILDSLLEQAATEARRELLAKVWREFGADAHTIARIERLIEESQP